MANLLYQILVCILVMVQIHMLEGKEQLFEYTGLDNKNPGLRNLKEEIRYHSRVTRDITPTSSPGNITKNGTVLANTTKTVKDDHKYYSTEFHSDGLKFWNDISGKEGADKHQFLSGSSLARATLRTSFDFPYYGHLIRDLTATSSGFLNLGNSTARLITEIQYVAPLQAYFNPSLSGNASVSYYDDGKQFIVQWTNIHLHEDFQAGPFTFQCILKKDGTIIFVYKTIPINVQRISTDKHPVKVGVSDSFHYDFVFQVFGRKIYRRRHYIYDQVKLDINQITNGSAYILNPKPTCILAKSCGECMNTRMNTAFKCSWCTNIGRCSDGFDRQRVEWRVNRCFDYAVSTKEQCNAKTTKAAPTTVGTTPTLNSRVGGGAAGRTGKGGSSGLSSGGVAAIVIFLMVIPLLIFGAVITYAYLHPTSRAGLYLIEHNPRRWFQNRKENQSSQYENHK